MSALESLQKIAKDLEIDIVDKNEEELRAAIKDAEAKKKSSSQGSEKEKASGQQPQKQEVVFNLAIVYHGNQEVRRYTKDTHGKDFADLAEQFASKKGFQVVMDQAKPGVICPSCGHKFYPK